MTAKGRRAGGIEVVVRGRDLVVYAVPVTVDEVAERMMDAGATLVRVAIVGGDLPAQLRSAMPEVPSRWREYGWDEVRVRPVRPSSTEIGRMDEVLSWLLLLGPVHRKAAFLHFGLGLPFRRIARAIGVASPTTVQKRAEEGCATILRSLANRSGQNGQKTAA
jgi:hypothetical protein